jgi:hypothetical protein
MATSIIQESFRKKKIDVKITSLVSRISDKLIFRPLVAVSQTLPDALDHDWWKSGIRVSY